MHRNMPVDLVLVRHGQSEGNLAQKLARQGELDLWTSEFRDRHNSLYRLTDMGRMQARIAGEYIRQNISPFFDKYFTSEYVRAMETAAALHLPHARWATEVYLRERDRGVLANKPHQERVKDHKEEFVRKERDAFYWQPSGGESIANLCLRVDRVLENFGENCSGLRVIVVCHGGVIKSFRALIERVRSTEYRSHDKIHNCQIVWYTRRDPKTGYISSKYNWVKSVCPWNLRFSRYSNEWRDIKRHVYSNVELLRSVSQVAQIVNSPLEDSSLMDQIDFYDSSDSSDSDEPIDRTQQILKSTHSTASLLKSPSNIGKPSAISSASSNHGSLIRSMPSYPAHQILTDPKNRKSKSKVYVPTDEVATDASDQIDDEEAGRKNKTIRTQKQAVEESDNIGLLQKRKPSDASKHTEEEQSPRRSRPSSNSISVTSKGAATTGKQYEAKMKSPYRGGKQSGGTTTPRMSIAGKASPSIMGVNDVQQQSQLQQQQQQQQPQQQPQQQQQLQQLQQQSLQQQPHQQLLQQQLQLQQLQLLQQQQAHQQQLLLRQTQQLHQQHQEQAQQQPQLLLQQQQQPQQLLLQQQQQAQQQSQQPQQQLLLQQHPQPQQLLLQQQQQPQQAQAQRLLLQQQQQPQQLLLQQQQQAQQQSQQPQQLLLQQHQQPQQLLLQHHQQPQAQQAQQPQQQLLLQQQQQTQQQQAQPQQQLLLQQQQQALLLQQQQSLQNLQQQPHQRLLQQQQHQLQQQQLQQHQQQIQQFSASHSMHNPDSPNRIDGKFLLQRHWIANLDTDSDASSSDEIMPEYLSSRSGLSTAVSVQSSYGVVGDPNSVCQARLPNTVATRRRNNILDKTTDVPRRITRTDNPIGGPLHNDSPKGRIEHRSALHEENRSSHTKSIGTEYENTIDSGETFKVLCYDMNDVKRKQANQSPGCRASSSPPPPREGRKWIVNDEKHQETRNGDQRSQSMELENPRTGEGHRNRQIVNTENEKTYQENKQEVQQIEKYEIKENYKRIKEDGNRRNSLNHSSPITSAFYELQPIPPPTQASSELFNDRYSHDSTDDCQQQTSYDNELNYRPIKNSSSYYSTEIKSMEAKFYLINSQHHHLIPISPQLVRTLNIPPLPVPYITSPHRSYYSDYESGINNSNVYFTSDRLNCDGDQQKTIDSINPNWTNGLDQGIDWSDSEHRNLDTKQETVKPDRRIREMTERSYSSLEKTSVNKNNEKQETHWKRIDKSMREELDTKQSKKMERMENDRHRINKRTDEIYNQSSGLSADDEVSFAADDDDEDSDTNGRVLPRAAEFVSVGIPAEISRRGGDWSNEETNKSKDDEDLVDIEKKLDNSRNEDDVSAKSKQEQNIKAVNSSEGVEESKNEKEENEVIKNRNYEDVSPHSSFASLSKAGDSSDSIALSTDSEDNKSDDDRILYCNNLIQTPDPFSHQTQFINHRFQKQRECEKRKKKKKDFPIKPILAINGRNKS